MKLLHSVIEKARPLFEDGGKLSFFYPLFELTDTFLLSQEDATTKGAHVRDAADLKRLMSFVIVALIPCTLFGMWNAGHQYNLSNEAVITPNSGVVGVFMFDIIRGAIITLPIIFTSYLVGGLWEVLFACVRKHEVNEGFLVTGLLFPLVLPPTTPLWMVALGVSFGVVIGKEVFGGTGMNIMNPALVGRAFLFFAYPTRMAGDVWTRIGHDNIFVEWFTNKPVPVAVQGYTGATPLSIVANIPDGTTAVDALQTAGFNFFDMFLGTIPGCIGETSTLMCLCGAFILIFCGVASWRVMISAVIGLIGAALLANHIGDGGFAAIPFQYHLVMGGFAFGTVFMMTDPVSSAATNVGKVLYGFLYGIIVIIVRVVNPAFPEGVMLAILFMNVIAPTIDNFVVEAHMKRRVKRV